MINYKNIAEITVKTQKELDDIPFDFKGRIYIKFGDRWQPAIVKNNYYRSVVARENSSVVAWENSSVVAWENSSVVAWENSSVVAWENSSVVAWENSSVVAWENSSVVANGNSQIVDRLRGGKIQILGNARTVYMPKTIDDFMSFYGIKHTKTKATFYKAVHKRDEKYIADHDNKFEYLIGKTAKVSDININTFKTCGNGLHISHLDWALRFGESWKDLAILKVETAIDDIVMPVDTNGKVRMSKIKVLEEVPLEDCGVYGKILAKRASQ